AVLDGINDIIKQLDDKQIYENFYKELEFGTGGIRGEIGAGTNAMNVYTVGRATQGLAEVMKKKGNVSAAIGYDSRHKSELFAKHSAAILAANGIKVYLYKQLMPTPCVSFAVRELKCACGIMITASHNPGKYNGYKVFGDDGCQLNLEDSKAVMDVILKTDVKLVDFHQALNNNTVEYISETVIDKFYVNVLSRQVNKGLINQSGLNLVYTPLNGAGNKPVRKALSLAGIENISVVAEQENPDGDFPTCP
ncbi:MAG: phospho-sugar mutase, partial [Oscillospiraceae bacterium]